MVIMDKEQLKVVLDNHKKWVLDEGGVRADLSGAYLRGAYFRGADLSDANLSGADLSGADLSFVNLSFVNLSFADLRGANLSGANLSGANLSGADLSDADLSGAHLSGANLSFANLRDADLRDADLRGADLRGADLTDMVGYPRTSAEVTEDHEKGVSDGSTAEYYSFKDIGATEIQHLISHKNMNAQIGEIFRTCYRYGEASHSNQLREAKKIRFYVEAEIERLEKLQ